MRIQCRPGSLEFKGEDVHPLKLVTVAGSVWTQNSLRDVVCSPCRVFVSFYCNRQYPIPWTKNQNPPTDSSRRPPRKPQGRERFWEKVALLDKGFTFLTCLTGGVCPRARVSQLLTMDGGAGPSRSPVSLSGTRSGSLLLQVPVSRTHLSKRPIKVSSSCSS